MAATDRPLPAAATPPLPARRAVHGDFLVAAAAALAEAGLVSALAAGWVTFAPAAAAHVLVGLALGGRAAVLARRPDGPSPAAVMLPFVTFVFGPLGALGVAIAVLVRAVSWRSDASFEEWYRALFPDAVERPRVGALAMESAGDQVNIGPLMDVLSHGTRPQKQVALAVLTRQFTPVFAPALKMALRDADNAIRVQAATSMATIENDFGKRAQALEAAAKAEPQALDRLKAVARHYDEYAATGLLDPVREKRSRRAALSRYIRYVRVRSDDREARHAIARLLMRGGRFRAAASWIERCLADGVFAPNLSPWYMECLYRMGRFADLRAFARSRADELERLELFPVNVVETARLWAGRADPATWGRPT